LKVREAARVSIQMINQKKEDPLPSIDLAKTNNSSTDQDT